MSVDGYLCLWVPAGFCDCLPVSEGANWYLKVPTGVRGYLLISECTY